MASRAARLLAAGLLLPLAAGIQGGIEIKQKERIITQKVGPLLLLPSLLQVDPERGNKEIYTSMRDMEAFMEEELEFVEDLQALYDKKLISMEAKVGWLVDASAVYNALSRGTSGRTFPVSWR
jgi:hypothetical protein